jgi:ABC-type nitrate/sulfonate/bicarbonate transport system substrate-binding protein
MPDIQTIKLGGVPEHFNLPIHLAIENGDFEQRGVAVDWTTFDGGTGQMTKALRSGEVDACILLTEGIIKDIIHGNSAKIISGYINTPLIWGIHTGTKNTLTEVKDIYNHQYGISRFGSGSHLMAIVDATVNDKVISKDQFSIIKNLDGALVSLENLETDVFYWEKYTTKPYVDSGQLRRVGEFITPWPCFVIAATDKILKEQPEAIIRMLRTIHDSCDQFMQTDDSIPLVAKRYHQQLKDVERWYHSTEWAIHGWVSDKMLKSVVHNLQVANIIDGDFPTSTLIWKRV